MKTTKAEVEKLSGNMKLQQLIKEALLAHLTKQLPVFEEWAKLDRILNAHKERGAEGRLDETQKGQEYIDDVNIPLLFFILDTFEAQTHELFFTKDRIFSFDPIGKEDVDKGKKLTGAVWAAARAFGNNTELKRCFSAGWKYGVGPLALSWKTKSEQFYSKGSAAIKERSVETKLTMAGVKYTSLSPYRFIWDPEVPMEKPDQMRFMGHWEPISKYDLQRQHGIKIDKFESDFWLLALSENYQQLSAALGMNYTDNQMTIRLNLYLDLVPKDYDLGDSTDPVVYHIIMAGMDRILWAKPAKLPEGKFPYLCLVPDGDGHTLRPKSRLDLTKDLQSVINWLFNSRIWAIRGDLGGDYIIDPSLVNMSDIEDRDKSRTGRNYFRLNQAAWGRPGAVGDAIHRLDFGNNTKDWLKDGLQLIDLIKLITGATDPLIGGNEDPSSRRTAEEIASGRKAAAGRMLNKAGTIHSDFMVPLGYRTAKYTQALLEDDILMRLDADGAYTLVEWADILLHFDVTVGDGYLAVDQTQLSNSWDQIVSLVFSNDRLMAGFNTFELLKDFGEVKGIKQFEKYLSVEGLTMVQAAALRQGTMTGQQ